MYMHTYSIILENWIVICRVHLRSCTEQFTYSAFTWFNRDLPLEIIMEKRKLEESHVKLLRKIRAVSSITCTMLNACAQQVISFAVCTLCMSII